MRKLCLLAFIAVAIAAPAQAQEMSLTRVSEPTFYLNVESADVLPQATTYVSLGGGYGFGTNYLSLAFDRGVGAGGELEAAIAGVITPGNLLYAGSTFTSESLGYKQGIASLGSWHTALNGQVYYQAQGGLSPLTGFLLGVPFSTTAGPGELTLEPRALLPDMMNGLNASTYGVTAGYRWVLGDYWRLLLEAGLGYHHSGYLAYEGKLGVRFMPRSNVVVDLGIGLDALGMSAELVHPEQNSLANLTVRYGF